MRVKTEMFYSWEEWRELGTNLAALAYLAACGCAFSDDGVYPASAARPISWDIDLKFKMKKD